MIKLLIFHTFILITRCGEADKNRDHGAVVSRSNPVLTSLFIFQLENILRSNLNFSSSYGRLTDLKSLLELLLVSFIWLGENFFGGETLSPHVQT